MCKEYSEFSHQSVLLAECIEALNIKPDGIYVDCTAGGGGHSSAILAQLGAGGHLIAIDKDETALQASQERLSAVKSAAEVSLLKSDFRNLANCLHEQGIEKVSGVLADLGVSSHQIDTPERGFAFRKDGPLDMRMDKTQELDCYTVVNTYPQKELERIFRIYGEERFSRSVAAAIVKRRDGAALSSTLELAQIIASAMPAAARRQKHPAKRCFQALRIEVNDELGALEELLQQALDLLEPQGRLCIISFHSLEDRLVKQQFRDWEQRCRCPRNLPCVCGKLPLGSLIGRQGYVASDEELADNSRSHSARLRVFERNGNPLT